MNFCLKFKLFLRLLWFFDLPNTGLSRKGWFGYSNLVWWLTPHGKAAGFGELKDSPRLMQKDTDPPWTWITKNSSISIYYWPVTDHVHLKAVGRARKSLFRNGLFSKQHLKANSFQNFTNIKVRISSWLMVSSFTS